MKIPLCPFNALIVTIEKKYYDSVTFSSGITLEIDPTWHPEEHAMLKAKVINVPLGITNRYDYRGMICSIQPGDEILMRYDVVFSYHKQLDNKTSEFKNMLVWFNEDTGQHEEFWRCDIQQVFAVIKEGEYIMQNGYVMLEPFAVAELRPTFLHMPEMIKDDAPKFKATVKYINQPLTTETTIDINTGDVVAFNPLVVQKYEIDTKLLWIIKQSHILAKVV